MKKIVLASTSPYRRQQLGTLGIPFECVKPLFDEDHFKHEIINDFKTPQAMAQKLSLEKGRSIAQSQMITISGDQLVALDGQILGKPGTLDNAADQLNRMQGKTHELITACTIFDGETPIEILNITRIRLKPLTSAQIQAYINLDQPVDCAGSYKIEKHGIQLVEDIQTEDFTAIQGLPLIALSKVFSSLKIEIPYLGEKK